MKRVRFAKQYVNKDFVFLKWVIFTSESNFNIKYSDGAVKIWPEKNKRILPTFKDRRGRQRNYVR